MAHSFLTIVIPFPYQHQAKAEEEIASLGNPLMKGWRKEVDAIGTIHFFSINVVPPEQPGRQANLLIEMTIDGSVDKALQHWIEVLNMPLNRIVVALNAEDNRVSNPASLLSDPRYRVNVGVRWRDKIGLNFCGTPEMTVERIVDEAELAEFASSRIFESNATTTPLEKLAALRNEIVEKTKTASSPEGKRFARILLPEPVPFLGGPGTTTAAIIPALFFKVLTSFLLPMTLTIGGFSALSFAIGVLRRMWHGFGFVEAALRSLPFTLVAALLVGVAFVLLIGTAFIILRRREKAESTVVQWPDQTTVAAIMSRENANLTESMHDDVIETSQDAASIPLAKDHSTETPPDAVAPVHQNHMFAVSIVKAGLLRRLTLRLAFWTIANLLGKLYRPGFLGEIGTIHFARWVLLPRTNQLIFLSNYGGSWESYLEDFITKASQGLTAIWSNAIGFPQSRALFLDGATDGDRFKLWARRQQLPTLCWYTAYPSLSTARIRVNAAIRQGILTAITPSEAADWISCFNSAPNTATSLEAEEIQSLAFGAMGHLSFAKALILNFSKEVKQTKEWLRSVEPTITTAQQFPDITASILAFTHAGIKKMTLADAVIGHFPPAFEYGMNAEWRARILGDIDEDGPDHWDWGGTKEPQSEVHAILLLFSKTAEDLEILLKREKRRASDYQSKIVKVIKLEVNKPNGSDQAIEPFGFADGISQPIVKGTPRAKKFPNETDHLVESGEFILGYPDNRGFLPPTPIVGANSDPKGLLHTTMVNQHRQRPDFTISEASIERDFGRNGSYLVVRQLQQDVAAFNAYIAGEAMRLKSSAMIKWVDADLSTVTLEEWIGAKMIGRWKDGSSIARHPSRPRTAMAGKREFADNQFRYGEDDPSGFACPLSAHIRRANPRDSFMPGSDLQRQITNRHRILRVGRSFGEDGKSPTGLFFMCLNADIERQFEFVQQTWCMATQFHGVNNETDPILGRGIKSTQMTIPTPAGPIKIKGLRKFISMRGGGYFFMPSRSALRWLSVN